MFLLEKKVDRIFSIMVIHDVKSNPVKLRPAGFRSWGALGVIPIVLSSPLKRKFIYFYILFLPTAFFLLNPTKINSYRPQ